MAADATLQDGEFLIQIEVERPGARLEAAGDAVIKVTQKHLDAAAEMARAAAATLGKALQTAGPDNGSVEFAITFEGEAGLPVLAKGKVGATLTVTLGWGGNALGGAAPAP